uniref:Uncharacterized protein n=1 Tax=Triticum urartu TaxID=4572 RepID=A0A8R7UY13_TRIUA
MCQRTHPTLVRMLSITRLHQQIYKWYTHALSSASPLQLKLPLQLSPPRKLWCEHVVVAASVDEGPEELIHQVHLSPALFNYASGADSVVLSCHRQPSSLISGRHPEVLGLHYTFSRP